MNAARRNRQKTNRIAAGGHSHSEHVPGERCEQCRPSAWTPEARAHARAQRQETTRRMGGLLPWLKLPGKVTDPAQHHPKRGRGRLLQRRTHG